MATTIAQLVTRLGFTIDAAALKRYKDSIDKVANETIAKVGKIGFALGSALIGISAKTFGNFEASLNELAAVSGATGGQLDNLKKQALDLGASTKFSAQQVAEGQIALSRAGFTTTQTLEATAGVTALAAANNLTLADSADIAASTMGGFGLEANQMTRVADVLSATVSASNQQISDLRESMKFVAPNAKTAGQSFENTAGLLGILANNGLRGTVAATGLNQILAKFADPKSRKEFEKLGVSVTNSDGTFRDLLDVLRDVKKRTDQMTQSEKVATNQRLFGLIGQKSANAIMGTTIENQNKVMRATNNATGASKRMSDIMNKGLNAEFARFSAALEAVLIKLGEQFAPVIISLLKGAQSLLTAFTNLSPTTLQVIRNLTLLFTALSGIAAVVASVKLAFVALSPVLAPIGAAIGAITLKGLALAAVFVGAVALIGLVIQDIVTFVNGGDSLIGRFVDKNKVLVETIKEIFLKAANGFQAMFFIASSLFNGIVNFISGIVTKFMSFIETSALVQAQLQLIEAVFKTVFNGIQTVVNAVFDRIVLRINQFINLITKAANLITGLFSAAGKLTGVTDLAFGGDQQPAPPKFDREAFLKNLKASRPDLIAGAINQVPAPPPGPQQTNNQQTNNNQFQNSITVNVGDSNSSAAEIGTAVAGATTNSVRKQLASAARNTPAVVR